ncbi:serine hydrolase domain-containing protein [Undibacterium sp. RuTC16W]|uniref:serine hydrolase domain-containing protein n=1 Tax=Undibacterium sp. RuTC16W TaxID=3413048 RepID=UPI003BF3C12E
MYLDQGRLILLVCASLLACSSRFAQATEADPAQVISTPHAIQTLDGSYLPVQTLEKTVTDLMTRSCVTGLGIAIFNENKIVYLNSFGWRQKEQRLPLNVDSVMYGASFTKAVFATMVAQLVQEGILDLDKPVEQYLPKPLPEYDKYRDLANDPRYQRITLRMLLNHTAGFANFRRLNPDKKLMLHFMPGSRYAYSGDGINLAQFIVEQVTKKSVGDLMQERIFNPLHMLNTSMTWQEHFNENLAFGHDDKEKILGHNRRSSVNAAGSMDTTISDFAQFIQSLMQGKILNQQGKDILLKPGITINSVTQFPTLSSATTQDNQAIQLSYGLGWGLFQTPYGKAYFKEGHDDGWENHALVYDDKQIGIVLMSNSANGDSIFKELLEALIKDTYTPWKWEGYIPGACAVGEGVK